MSLRASAAAAALLAALGFSCGDSDPAVVDAGAGGDATASFDGSMPGSLGACLERPTDLPRPPAGQLPCELFPPGFVR
jgi:hypothetical protein